MKKLEHLTPYLAYNLQIALTKTIVLNMSGKRTQANNEVNIYDVVNLPGYQPLLIPMDQLKNYMGVILNDVSLFDLSDCTFHVEEDENNIYVNAINKNGVVVDALSYDGNCFQIMDDGYNSTLKMLSPQYSGYEALARHHFDYMELIDTGFALNKLDYYPNLRTLKVITQPEKTADVK